MRRGGVIYGVSRDVVSAGIAAVLLLGASDAHATTVGCNTVSAGEVHLNHCRNYNYFPVSEAYALQAQAASLDKLRARLVGAGRLSNEPVLFELPPWEGGLPPGVTHHASCMPDAGDSDRTPSPLGPCHLIRLDPPQQTYAGMREALVAAAGIPLAQAGSAAFLGVHIDGAVIDGPAKDLRIRERWVDGRATYVLVQGAQPERVLRSLAAPAGEPVGPPRWSPNGFNVMIASLDEVIVHDVRTQRTFRLNVPHALSLGADASHMDTRVRFVDDQTVEIAADASLRTDYHHAAWRFAHGDVESREASAQAPTWP